MNFQYHWFLLPVEDSSVLYLNYNQNEQSFLTSKFYSTYICRKNKYPKLIHPLSCKVPKLLCFLFQFTACFIAHIFCLSSGAKSLRKDEQLTMLWARKEYQLPEILKLLLVWMNVCLETDFPLFDFHFVWSHARKIFKTTILLGRRHESCNPKMIISHWLGFLFRRHRRICITPK